jgi:type I restriction enzyme S subunit
MTLSEIADIITGATPSSIFENSWGNHLDFITPSDQRDDQREVIAERQLSVEGAKRLSKRIVPARSTNLTCIGSTIGKVSMTMKTCVTNQQINSMVARDGLSDSDYVYYMIRNWSQSLKQAAAGSATPIVSKSLLAKCQFSIPALPEQRAIAEVLNALDDKIAANAKLVNISDTLARVTFDRMLDDSESVPLTEVAQFINGKAFTNGATGTGRVVIRIAELNSGIGDSTVYNDIDVADKHLARPGDLLFAWSGSLTLHRWFRPEAIVNQHIFKVMSSTGYPVWCPYGLIVRKLDEFKAIAAGKATTMGHIQRRHLEEPVDVPVRSVIEHYDCLMTMLWNRALAAEQESLVLASVRDALLPQLMSGKIRVEDAKKTVEEVL